MLSVLMQCISIACLISLLWVAAGYAIAFGDGGAAMALVVTHISAATASLTWALWERIRHGKASMVGLVTGTIPGLASVTPASGFIGPLGALVIGAVAGVLRQLAVGFVKERLRIDDTFDVFAVHAVGGIFGTLMAPVLATVPLEGGQGLVTQVVSLVVVGAFTLAGTFLVAQLAALLFPMRVSDEDEFEGLDITQHGERAYDLASWRPRTGSAGPDPDYQTRRPGRRRDRGAPCKGPGSPRAGTSRDDRSHYDWELAGYMHAR